ncbi:hypothetical protein FRC12_006386 [Ceratobasidium sp. 428]|nr:hypothetical protein FRC12_006386 [Ceratobasidium sp. 428]
MGLKYLFRSSFYLSSDFATRMGVPVRLVEYRREQAGEGVTDDKPVKASSPARKEQRAPRFAAYLPPALRNGSRTAAHGIAAESSRVAAVQKLDRDTQEMQDARRGDPETRLGLGPATTATVDVEPEEPGAVVNGDAEEAPRKRRTRRGKRAGRPRGQKAEVDQGQETEMEMGVAPELWVGLADGGKRIEEW